MVSSQLQQRIQLLVQIQGVQKTAQQLKKVELGLSKTFAGEKFGPKGGGFAAVNKQVKDMNIGLEKASMTTKKFKMEYLGILFAGMALQRVTMGFLRSAVTSYEKAFEKQSKFEKATNRVTAAWEFFKFSLIDTLAASPAFAVIVEFLANIVDKLSELSSSQLLAIIATIGGAAIAGTFLWALGSIVLAIDSIGMAFPGMKTKALNAFGSIKKAANIGIGFFFIMDAIDEFKEGKTFSGIAEALAGAGFFLTAFGEGKAATKAWVASLAFEIASVIAGEQSFKDAIDEVSNTLLIMGAMNLGKGGGWLIVIGVAIRFLDPIKEAFNKNILDPFQKLLPDEGFGSIGFFNKNEKTDTGLVGPSDGMLEPIENAMEPMKKLTRIVEEVKNPASRWDMLKESLIGIKSPIKTLTNTTIPNYNVELGNNMKALDNNSTAIENNTNQTLDNNRAKAGAIDKLWSKT